jgi:purine-binding chemotaxis protein CheW
MTETREDILYGLECVEQEVRRLKHQLLASSERRGTAVLPVEAVVTGVDEVLLALPVAQVQEVTRMVQVSRLPQAPRAIAGTINYRGQLVPVVDLRARLAGASKALSSDSFLVVVRTEERLFSLIVDNVTGVQRFEEGDAAGSQASSSSLPTFVTCLLRLDHRAVCLVDPAGLLTAAELNVLVEMLSQLPTAPESTP